MLLRTGQKQPKRNLVQSQFSKYVSYSKLNEDTYSYMRRYILTFLCFYCKIKVMVFERASMLISTHAKFEVACENFVWACYIAICNFGVILVWSKEVFFHPLIFLTAGKAISKRKKGKNVKVDRTPNCNPLKAAQSKLTLLVTNYHSYLIDGVNADKLFRWNWKST